MIALKKIKGSKATGMDRIVTEVLKMEALT